MRLTRSALLASIFVFASTAIGQEGRSANEKPVDENAPVIGIRISTKVLNGFLDQFVQRMERQYDLTPDQIREIQGVFREKVPKFLMDNQGEFEKLANEFLDTLNQNEAPSPEQVAEWSKRALPMLAKAQQFMGEMSEGMKDHMEDEQVVKLEATMAAMDVGAQLVTTRMQNWAAGNYDPATEWHRNPGARQRDREREREARRAMEEARTSTLREYGMEAEAGRSGRATEAAAAPEAQPAAPSNPTPMAKAKPKDEWEKYVEDFIVRYELDSDQRAKADLALSAARDQKDKHLSAKNAEIERLGAKFAELKKQQNKDALVEAEAQYAALMRPVDLAFEKLKEKLDKLPTRAQRAKAATREEKKPDAATAPVGGERAQRP